MDGRGNTRPSFFQGEIMLVRTIQPYGAYKANRVLRMGDEKAQELIRKGVVISAEAVSEEVVREVPATEPPKGDNPFCRS
jgi:hypothetical protein